MLLRLDHLIQYKVDRISTHEKHPAIVFDNGVKILFSPKLKKQADELQGQKLLSVEEAGDAMKLYFERGDTITLQKGYYSIFDPRFGEILDPHEPQDVNADIPDEPADRISAGPTDDEVREEFERASKNEAEETAGEAE